MKDIIKYFENGDVVVSLSGELDHHGVAAIRDDIDASLFSFKPKRLVFDLGGVEFMDSSGLGLILGRYARTSALGIPIIIRRPSARHKRLLCMAEMQKIVKIEEREECEDEKAAK